LCHLEDYSNLVNCYGHVVQRRHTFVMIMIRRSTRYCVDREDVGGGKEKRNITALAHLVYTTVTSTQRTRAPSIGH
jgi:hypothetical protein